MVNETVDREPLEDIAVKIVQLANDAEESVITAAVLIREAKRRVEEGDAGEVHWAQWAKHNIDLKPTRLRELVRIAEAKDPRAELERQRSLIAARQQKHRDKKRNIKQFAPTKQPSAPSSAGAAISAATPVKAAASPAPLRNGAKAPTLSRETADDRQQLIDWAKTASDDQIEQVLTFVRKQGFMGAPKNAA